MNQHARLRTLESLNNDVLIAILASCDSFGDLASFIRASPTLLRAFLSAKPAVLLGVVGNILGPATRDAALLARTSRIRGEDRERRTDAVVQDYRARLRVAAAPWVTTLDADAAVALTRVTRLAQLFVDLFVYFRFRYFAHELDAARASPPQRCLSRTERGRVAQAVLRCQLLKHIYEGKYYEPRDYYLFVRTVSSLFHPWEMEQVSSMDHFLGQLIVSLAEYAVKKQGRNSERNPTRWYYWWKHHTIDLEEFATKIKSALDSDSSLLESVCEGGEVFSGRLSIAYGFYDIFRGSHYTTLITLPVEQQLASDMTSVEFGQETSTSRQPWAWEDALQRHETDRWGRDLVKFHRLANPRRQEYDQAASALASWRWFGMVFWDRERAEQLKQSSALEFCKSGWLVPWQD